MVNHCSALSSLYTDECDIWQATNTMDATTKRKTLTWSKVVTGQSCRLSYNSSQTATKGNVSEIGQEITLFLPLTVTVLAGSRIDVTRSGTTTSYVASSEPKRFNLTKHQEVGLRLKDGEA